MATKPGGMKRPSKRITGKQRAARKRNIAVARKAKKTGGNSGFSSKAINRQLGRRQDTPSNRKTAIKELKKAVDYYRDKRFKRGY